MKITARVVIRRHKGWRRVSLYDSWGPGEEEVDDCFVSDLNALFFQDYGKCFRSSKTLRTTILSVYQSRPVSTNQRRGSVEIISNVVVNKLAIKAARNKLFCELFEAPNTSSKDVYQACLSSSCWFDRFGWSPASRE
ncbi:uncharacterized protein LOC116303254 [Actinia tenebrosa]|uniref:Uncharacterized protein LOC116303254 n=1 Tax=Actinia tenebrosa TaxID=6105 RepID=A0A6P8IQC6_ACTTE|nr:uncharacterized protein LOC116303254 [Actinia tenebrosa]